jgi:hypothetical protein
MADFLTGSVSTLTYSSSSGPVVFVVRNGQVRERFFSVFLYIRF